VSILGFSDVTASVAKGVAAGAVGTLNWGSALGMLPSLDLAPNPKEWGTKALSIDALRHAVYAVAVSAAYDAMSD
jgi:hypothetical protein